MVSPDAPENGTDKTALSLIFPVITDAFVQIRQRCLVLASFKGFNRFVPVNSPVRLSVAERLLFNERKPEKVEKILVLRIKDTGNQWTQVLPSYIGF